MSDDLYETYRLGGMSDFAIPSDGPEAHLPECVSAGLPTCICDSLAGYGERVSRTSSGSWAAGHALSFRHDPRCRNRYQRNTPVEHCPDCDLIASVRSEYVAPSTFVIRAIGAVEAISLDDVFEVVRSRMSDDFDFASDAEIVRAALDTAMKALRKIGGPTPDVV